MTYVASKEVVYAYTTGGCGHLALELRRLTGLPIVVHGNPVALIHAGLWVNEFVLDVNGLTHASAWESQWRWGTSATQLLEDDEDVQDYFAGMSPFTKHNSRALARRLCNAFDIPTTGRRHRDALTH